MGQALDVMQRWFEKLDYSLLADDIDWYVAGYPVPKERYHGRAAVGEEFFPALRADFSVFRAEVEELIEAGDRVTAVGRYRGTTSGGTDVVIPYLHVWTVRNGRIARLIAVADFTQVAAA
jgi:ketosteroid isomerase-like protein